MDQDRIDVILLKRADWGADPNLPRRGHALGPLLRTEVFIHHTVIIDVDDTANEWESLEDVRSKMRQLQLIRPDLGWDVPYNIVAFCMSGGDLAFCEGRGLDRSGAHTRGHNRTALGIAFQGDFESGDLPEQIDSHLNELAVWLRDLRNERGYANLGNSRPGDRQVWGHRDASSAGTLCPGSKLYKRLGTIRFIDEDDDIAMDKPTWKLVQRALQAQDPPLYGSRLIDGMPGRNTNIALRAFEKRVALTPRGVIGAPNHPRSTIWPATRELLFAAGWSTLGR